MKLNMFFAKQRKYLPFWISLLIIITISLISYHGDFIVVSKIAEKIANGNLHIYQDLYIGSVNTGKPIMPPLICLMDGLFYFFVKELRVLDFSYNFTEHIPALNLLLLKSRYILVFAISYPLINKAALLFTKQNKELARRIANLWIASPLLVYLPFAQGNNDIYPAVFSLIFLLFAFRKNFIMAMIFLGLTAALKNYAIFLIVPVALILSDKNLKKTVLYCLASGLAYILPTLIFFKGLAHFTSANGEGLLMFKPVISSYSTFAIGYFLILLFLYFSDNIKKIIENKSETLVTYCFLVMSLFYVTFFIPQWFLWILPFFVFLIYKNKKLYSIYILISSVYFLSLITNWPNNLDLNLWSRILPTLTPGSRYFPGIVNQSIMMLVGSLFVSLFIVFIYFLLANKKKEEEAENISVYKSYLPTAILILMLVSFSFITVYQTNTKAKENSLVIEALSSQNQKSYSLSGNEIASQSTLINIEFKNGGFEPSNPDPQFYLNNVNYDFNSNSYVVIRFKDKISHNPQLFYDTDGNGLFLESQSAWLTKADDQTYYARLGQKFINSSPKSFRIDPETSHEPFEIDYFKIVDIHSN